jgi:hypothetical protein
MICEQSHSHFCYQRENGAKMSESGSVRIQEKALRERKEDIGSIVGFYLQEVQRTIRTESDAADGRSGSGDLPRAVVETSKEESGAPDSERSG